MQGVYRIRSKLDDKRYIGSTQDFNERWGVHKKELQQGTHYNSHLQNAWNKYGGRNFAFEIEEEILGKQKIRLAREQVYLDEGFELGTLYNVARKAGGGDLGPEVNKKRSISKSGENHPNYGKPRSKEVRAKISKTLMGHSVTEETREKQSKAKMGENNSFYGKHHTEEWKQEHSRKISGENNYGYGKKQSRETCDKRSKTLMGHEVSEETRIKLRKAAIKWHETHENPSAKPYPAFYNLETEEFIPTGRNLLKMCREYSLNNTVMCNLRKGLTKKSSDGWRLATENEINSNEIQEFYIE